MPDGTSTILGMAMDGVKYVWFGLIGLVVWNGKRLHNRVDKIESEYVSGSSLDKAMDRIRDDIKSYHHDTREDIRSIHDRIDKLK